MCMVRNVSYGDLVMNSLTFVSPFTSHLPYGGQNDKGKLGISKLGTRNKTFINKIKFIYLIHII